MKRIISIICSFTKLIASVSFVLPTFAATGKSVDTVVEELSELYQEEAESGKELEDSAECRIIVKANRKPDTYGDAQFVKGTDKIYIYQYSDITSANDALEYYNSLSYVQWAETDDIDVGTFHRCYNLTEVDFPLVAGDIPEHCFDDCLKLEKVKFDNVSVIKYNAFNFCQKLNSIYFPKVKTIEQFAFYMAYNLKNADLYSVETIEDKAFVNTGIETINAPNLKKLGSYAFAEQSYMHLNWLVNSKLTTLVVPNLSEADNYAFAYTGGLT